MNNYNYINYDWYRNGTNNNNFIPNMNINPNQKLYSPQEGFEKGNLFQKLYSEYKNYRPAKLNPRNEQERKLQELQRITFATHDLNLYLDTHPEDQSMIQLFNDYNKQKEKLTEEYERNYGPMTVGNNNDSNTFIWANSTWPWEGYNV